MSETNLFQRKGIWYSRIQIQGRDQRRSLRTSSKIEARKKLRRVLEQIEHVREHGEERITWKAAVVDWASSMVGAVKPAVLTRYKISLRQLRPVLDDKFIDEIGTKMIAKIVSHRKGENVTNATIKRDLTAVSSVLRFCCAQGWIEENAALNYDRTVIRERRDPIALPDPEDIDGLVSFAPRTFGQIIRLAQYTGMRQNEISTLERRQVRGKIIDLWKTKTDRPRAVALDDRALGTLGGTTAHITEPWVFHHDDGLPFVGIKSQFRDLMSRAIKKTIVKNRFKFHDLRHWYAVDYLRRGGNIYDLQQHLGHSSIKTTEVYLAYLTPDEQRIAKFGRSAQSRHTYTGSSPSEEKDSALSH